ncbi:MAG: hypothetical protein WAK93_22490 [Solirubrobacteraceae bacterium]
MVPEEQIWTGELNAQAVARRVGLGKKSGLHSIRIKSSDEAFRQLVDVG